MPKDHFAGFEDQVRLKQEAERKEKERIHHELERERREKDAQGKEASHQNTVHNEKVISMITKVVHEFGLVAGGRGLGIFPRANFVENDRRDWGVNTYPGWTPHSYKITRADPVLYEWRVEAPDRYEIFCVAALTTSSRSNTYLKYVWRIDTVLVGTADVPRCAGNCYRSHHSEPVNLHHGEAIRNLDDGQEVAQALQAVYLRNYQLTGSINWDIELHR